MILNDRIEKASWTRPVTLVHTYVNHMPVEKTLLPAERKTASLKCTLGTRFFSSDEFSDVFRAGMKPEQLHKVWQCMGNACIIWMDGLTAHDYRGSSVVMTPVHQNRCTNTHNTDLSHLQSAAPGLVRVQRIGLKHFQGLQCVPLRGK